MGIVKEFREFALKGNVLDLAVAVIIGAAFGRIVNSVVNDLVMPIPASFGKADFSNLYVGVSQSAREKIAAATTTVNDLPVKPSLEEARKLGPVFAYGNFITEVINFTILAFCVFLVVKAFNTARKRFEREQVAAPPPPPPGPTNEERLLGEIRDLLRAGR